MTTLLSLDDFCIWVSEVAGQEVTPESKLVDDLGLDSIELYELVMRLGEFGTEIPDTDLRSDLSVRELYLLCLSYPTIS